MTTQNNLELAWAEDSVALDPGDIKYGIGWVAEIPTFEVMNFVLKNATTNQLVIAEQGFFNWEALITYQRGVTVIEAGEHYTATSSSTGELPSLDTVGTFWIKGRVLQFGGDDRLTTTADGIVVDGIVTSEDSMYVTDKLTNTPSYVLSNTIGETQLRMNAVGSLLFSQYSSVGVFEENWIAAYKDAQVEVAFNGATKLETLAGGVAVTGNVTVTSQSPAQDSAVRRDWVEANTILRNEILNLVYPIGALHISVNPVNPSAVIGGTWVSFGVGKTLVGVDPGDAAFDTPEETGGRKDAVVVSHTHTTGSDGGHNHLSGEILGANEPDYYGKVNVGDYTVTSIVSNAFTYQHYTSFVNDHTHTIYGSGESGVDQNMQPYIVTHIWKRTA